MTLQDYLRKYPNARPSTLVFIERRNAMTERLKTEVEADRNKRRRSWLFWIGWRNAQR